VTGSEVVGLLPLAAILAAAEFYIQREGLFLMEERQKVRLAVERLGLASLGEFKPEEKIIEYRVGSCKDGPLLSSSLRAFLSSLSARTSAPGGGSASVVAASMGAALGTMVGLLTYGKKKYEDLDDVMRKTIGPLHDNLQKMMPLVDRDSEAFAEYMVFHLLIADGIETASKD
jgi:glutamate formiminotransferase/formiminotetrahydrofolate cyclodeaminase